MTPQVSAPGKSRYANNDPLEMDELIIHLSLLSTLDLSGHPPASNKNWNWQRHRIPQLEAMRALQAWVLN